MQIFKEKFNEISENRIDICKNEKKQNKKM